MIIAAWWGSGYLFAYTDDAYLTSDIVSITPEVSGPINAVHVTDNQWVSRGTLLFTIDPVPFQLALERARAQEAQAQAQLPIDQAQLDALQAEEEVAEAAASLDAANLNRQLPLGPFGRHFGSDAGRVARCPGGEHRTCGRRSRQYIEGARNALRADQIAVASARASAELAEWRIGRTRVVAPVDGEVTDLVLQPGDMASPDHPAIALVDAHAWRVEADYKEYYLRHLTAGHVAWVWLDSHPWHLYRAHIQGIAHGISRVQGEAGLVPYVSPTVDWIRLQRRVPVRVILEDPPHAGALFMGTDARTLVIY